MSALEEVADLEGGLAGSVSPLHWATDAVTHGHVSYC